MANASRDGNRVPVLIGASNADGVTPLPVYVDSATNRLLVSTTGSSGGTSSTFGAAFPSTGTAVGAKDSTGTNMAALNLDASGYLKVNVAASSASGNAAASATGSAVPASADYVGINVGGTLRGQTGGNPTGTVYAAHCDLTSIGGNVTATGNGTASGALRVAIASDNTAFNIATVTTVSTVSAARIVGNGGAVLDGVNTAATAPANGILGLGIYNSTEPSPTTGQSVGLQQDSKGRLRQVIMDAAGNTRGANVNASNQLSVSVDAVSATNISTNVAQMNGVAVTMGNGVSGTGVQRVAIASDNSAVSGMGVGATGSAVPANAAYNAGNASTALATAATAGNTVGAMYDKFGRQVVLPLTIRDLVGTQTTTISASTTETTIVTAAASTFNDLMLLVISNTSATAARVDIRDTTAGSVLFSIYVPAGDVRGFSMGGVAIPQTTVNTNWTAQSSASVTDLRVYAVFAKNK